MKRTNVALDEAEFRLLDRIAIAESRSRAELIREAVQQFLSQRHRTAPASRDTWERRMARLLARVRRRTRAFSPEEIEADITAASREVRRRRNHAPRSRGHQRLGLGAP